MGRRVPLPGELPPGAAFTVAQGRSVGVADGRMRGRDLDRPHHGVRARALDLTSLVDRCTALLPVMGDDQVFSHVTAAALLGLPLSTRAAETAALDVLTVGAGRMRRPGVTGRQTDDDETPITYLAHLPVVAPARTWCHLAEVGRPLGIDRGWLVAIGDHLISGTRVPGGRTTPLAEPAELARAVGRHGSRRGAAHLEWALPRLRRPVDSPRESLLRLILIAGGLPEPEVQFAVMTAQGIRHADLGYREARLLIEYQGDDHRTSRTRWLADLTRRQLFEDAGYRVIEVGAADLTDESALVARIRRALQGRFFGV
jgi:very-short-patch-repair endonuclease